MNTFLLGSNYQQTARCLDPARLNRQIVECVHVAKALALMEIAREKYNRQIPFGVIFPPVIKLWMLDDDTTLLPELREYFDAMCMEWVRIKGKNHKSSESFNWMSLYSWYTLDQIRRKERPYKLEWDPLVYHSNYLKLLKKDPTHYGNSFQREGISFTVIVDGYPWLNPFLRLKDV